MHPETAAAFHTVARSLRRSEYRKLQHFPGHRQYLGSELRILRACLSGNGVAILRGSALQPLYRRWLHRRHPEVHHLYRTFYLCEPAAPSELRRFFAADEIDALSAAGLLSAADRELVSTVRFVPIDDLLIASSHAREYGTESFVYLGSDTVMFRDLIAGRLDSNVDQALEIGCGSGFLSIWLARRARQVTALDISEHALELTRLNAAINGIDNLTAAASDVYANVRGGPFDVIVSNPPYMFLPEQDAGRMHAYGGHLGMDITRRILLGLDSHLAAEGTAFIFSDSYIRDDGHNALHDLLQSSFDGKPWRITMTQVDYQPLRTHREFYREHRISHSIRYFVTIQKAAAFEFIHHRIGPAQRLVQGLKIRLRSE